MKKHLFFYLGILFFFAACEKKKPNNDLFSNTDIGIKVDELYTKYGRSNEAIYNQPIPDDLFSRDLKKVLEDAIQVSKADIEKVKNSAHPDEKPLIFEGAIFSSLYEGYTDYKIQSIDVSGNTADVTVQLEHSDAVEEAGSPKDSPKVVWTDRIHLINSGNNSWRIDNITFDKKIANSGDLKARMTEFVKVTP